MSDKPNPRKIVAAFNKTAGEVRFIKDRAGDTKEWAWNPPSVSERNISENFIFKAKDLKPLVLTLRSALMALGHATSAHSRFVKIKSRMVSPDGALGGLGYLQKITDMRRNLMNCIEVLSAFTDTIHDEVLAPHWHPAEDKMTPRDRQEVKDLVQETKEIQENPEGWAEGQEEKIDEEKADEQGTSKTAALKKQQSQDLTRSVAALSAGSSGLDPDTTKFVRNASRLVLDVSSAIGTLRGSLTASEKRSVEEHLGFVRDILSSRGAK